jgi:hypothetical protein
MRGLLLPDILRAANCASLTEFDIRCASVIAQSFDYELLLCHLRHTATGTAGKLTS